MAISKRRQASGLRPSFRPVRNKGMRYAFTSPQQMLAIFLNEAGRVIEGTKS